MQTLAKAFVIFFFSYIGIVLYSLFGGLSDRYGNGIVLLCFSMIILVALGYKFEPKQKYDAAANNYYDEFGYDMISDDSQTGGHMSHM